LETTIHALCRRQVGRGMTGKRRRTPRRGEAGEEGYSVGLVEGSVVIVDLDRFEEVVEERGWSQYSPNPATGLMTQLVKDFIRKWSGYIVYGLDEERGTEEAVIEIPLVCPEELREDLERIKTEINKLGVSITIVAVCGYVGLVQRNRNRREAYTATPARRLAAKMLQEAKRRGGNRIVIA
jgi:hypothetical protein